MNSGFKIELFWRTLDFRRRKVSIRFEDDQFGRFPKFMNFDGSSIITWEVEYRSVASDKGKGSVIAPKSS